MPKRKRLIVIFCILFIAVSFLTSFMRQKYVVPILMYHMVYPDAAPEYRLAVTDRAFKRQMRFLKEQSYNVLPLEELANLTKEKKKVPARTIAITFDDGYKDNLIYAFPILKKYNLPATIFIIVNEVGWPQKLNWEEIKIMQDSGLITFGSHTMNHKKPLTEIESNEELKKEIFDSKKILEEKLGRKVNTFSYPGGRFNSKVRQTVIDAGYKFAVATSPGKKFPSDDIFALKRLRISSSSDNLLVFWFETSGIYTFIKEHRDAD